MSYLRYKLVQLCHFAFIMHICSYSVSSNHPPNLKHLVCIV